ncbi:MAG: hypothetical protein QT11_C0001G0967 [archaeon GW2011_AR20]|nr:MAG: hypothetical protein QT11_C0001G0967 [archaeon GW2011_AR20]MBS3160188.1 hypothetical protein [Candidatus Woesearchaeota archaeon]
MNKKYVIIICILLFLSFTFVNVPAQNTCTPSTSERYCGTIKQVYVNDIICYGNNPTLSPRIVEDCGSGSCEGGKCVLTPPPNDNSFISSSNPTNPSPPLANTNDQSAYKNNLVNNVVLSLTLKYNNGKITQEGIKLIEGNPPDRLNQPAEGYMVKIISFDNQELYSLKFSIELTPINALDPSWFDEQGNQIFFPEETTEPLKEKVFVLNLPYFKNAKYVEIYDPTNELLLRIDVSDYTNPKGLSPLIIYSLIAGLLIIIVLVLFFKKKKSLEKGKRRKNKK